MPAAPKESVAKKPGAPKAKGAVRAKSGCYTCRIRRKKCDEHQNHEGYCDTCVRLRLQCLGFGAKRPEWLRESRNVSEMRDKIKVFLAAQGMIKGHAGAGARGSDQALPILKLEEDSTTPSSSESPPTPALTLSPIETPRHLQHESAIRDQHIPSSAWMPEYPQIHQLRGNSPFGGSSRSGSHHDPMYSNPYDAPNSIVAYRPPSSPALFSSFSGTYHIQYQIPEEDDVPEPLFFPDDNSNGAPYTLFVQAHKPGGASDELVTYYLGNVMDLQYLLADSFHVRSIISPSLTNQRGQYMPENFTALSDPDTHAKYEELMQVLRKPDGYTEDDAFAAISVISSILFDGGNGQWEEWLRLSYRYAHSVFRDNDPRDTLMNCQESTRFIIKASIWFDVLAAVTTQKEPRFLHYIRKLFSPEASGVFDPATPTPPELSMMSVMGCENHITSALAFWKQTQLRNGCLSIPELVLRANELDKTYLSQMPSQLVSNIFRSATRVYLRSIVSGDYTHVPEIMEAIDETMSFAKTPQSTKVMSCVVRSTVFAFFICGALSDNKQVRADCNEDLTSSMVGNSPVIKKLLKQMWHDRGSTRGPVPWRDVLRNANMLLV
ncbi:fungal-specific transcription factor domain-containing protein [Roridomyces roridus]|uniref:Fungal-specific transcription factor domain-containing protein n=1 Tax=Roridomyces roridus TaxID=1738132 RepID=A0AAD7CIT7_9AGAR|nr:fungal-specific transcription factor domain-containing protein [Roridomyces roridus]